MRNYYPYLTVKGLALAFITLFSFSSNAEALIVNDITDPGVISQNQTICPGVTPQLFESVEEASGGNPNLPIEYLWMTSNTLSTPTNNWNPAQGVNNTSTYQAGPVGITTYYVRCARRGTGAFVAESNVVKVTVLNSATANINGMPSGNIYSGTTVNLSATSSPGASYSWDFNGDGITDCNGLSCSYTYNTTGVFPVTLTVTSFQGCPVTTTIPINVINPTGFGYNDPCNCGNPLNFATPSTYFVNDFILINSTSGQTWTLSNITSGQVYDNNGNILPIGTVIPESGTSGQYFLNIWFASGTGYASSFSNGSNTVTTGTNNPCNCTNPLPVELVDFTAEEIDENVMLKWNTASETNNSHFQIQRSIDGNRFDYLDIVEGAGTTNNTTYYSFEDKSPLNGRSYYRLKQIDLDGSFEYSPIRQVYLETIGISIYPSPAEDQITIRTLKLQNSDAIIEIVNADARLIHRYVLPKETDLKGISLIDFDPGVYFVKIYFSNGSYETGSFMKN